MSQALLNIDHLKVAYPQQKDREIQWAVNGVSLTLQRGDRLGLVGESGCGKSTLGRAVMRLLPTASRVNGKVMFEDRSVLDLTFTQMRQFRGEAVALVFQDPMTRLDPLMTIGKHCMETLRAHQSHLSERELREKAIATLAAVKIPENRCKKNNLNYADPDKINVKEYENDQQVLVVHHAGEVLYRLADGTVPTIDD